MADKKEKKVELTEEQIKSEVEKRLHPKLTNEEFAMGKGELDIRELNQANKDQIMFRLLSELTTQNLQISQSLVDLQRLVMLLFIARGWNVDQLTDKLGKMLLDLDKKAKSIKSEVIKDN